MLKHGLKATNQIQSEQRCNNGKMTCNMIGKENGSKSNRKQEKKIKGKAKTIKRNKSRKLFMSRCLTLLENNPQQMKTGNNTAHT